VAEEKRLGAVRPAGTLRDAQKAMTRERLLRAAADAFARQGYAATTVEDVVSGAGATRPTFYLHFKTKADLVVELGDDVRTRVHAFNERLRAAVAAGDRTSIRAYLDSAFDFWEDIREFTLAEEEAAALEPEIRASRGSTFDEAVTSVVAGLEDAGRWTPSGRQVRAVLAYSQLQTVFHRWMRVGWDIDRKESLEVMTDMWMHAFVGPAAC
jgi:AcrR family transcriptional regulator